MQLLVKQSFSAIWHLQRAPGTLKIVFQRELLSAAGLPPADKRVVRIVDNRLNAEKIVQYGFGRAESAFHPGLVVRICFTHDENIDIRSFDQL